MTAYEPIRAAAGHQPYRFTERDYVLLSEHGAFEKYVKTELIEGVIYAVNAQYARHLRVQTILLRRLADTCDTLSAEVSAWVDGSISIDEQSMPQPDILIVSELPDEGPVPVCSLLLAVEVADSSLGQDLGLKAALYTRAGVPEYWVADVNGRVIHQMWAPQDGAYAERREVAFDQPIEAATITGLRIETTSL